VAAAGQALALLGAGEDTPARVPAAVSLDTQMRRIQEGVTQLAPVLAIGLFGLGALQVVRGQTLAPAVSMLWYAVDLLRLATTRAREDAPAPAR
jgi:hypothetical protein